MMWRLVRQHVSWSQLAGFVLASLAGMLIVLTAFQFYRDVSPVFTEPDSFMGADYLILAKKSAAEFDQQEVDDVSLQPFVSRVAPFQRALYRADVRMGVGDQPLINSELFFESVPDDFVDFSLNDWRFSSEKADEVPVVLPRSYLSMYNFGFAQSRQLPKLSEGLASMISFKITVGGDKYEGKVVGFSNRLNTILVPDSFMTWSNNRYAAGEQQQPTRLIVQVGNPTDERIAQWMDDEGYELETGDLNSEKTGWFLRLVVMIVMAVGLVISLLSFYILMLSIFLLVQKNAEKLQTLLLLGYPASRVARPYVWLTVALNALVLVVALVVVVVLRERWLDVVCRIFPDLREPSIMATVVLGLVLLLIVSLLNMVVIYRKISTLWSNKG